jgi:dienelactone hydrolase
MSIAVRCECGKQYSLDEKFAGKKVKCRKCGASMTIPNGAAARPFSPPADDFAAAVAAAADAVGEARRALESPRPKRPKPVEGKKQSIAAGSGGNLAFDCPNCGKGYEVPPSLEGKVVRCRSCGRNVTVPLRHVPTMDDEVVVMDDELLDNLEVVDPVAHSTVAPVEPPVHWPTAPLSPSPLQTIADPYAGQVIAGPPRPVGSELAYGLSEVHGNVAGPYVAGPLPQPGAAYGTPVARRGKRRKKKGNQMFANILIGLACTAGAFLFLGVLTFLIPALAVIVGIGCLMVGGLVATAGGFWFLGVAFGEDAVEGLLCLFVPFYSLYYLVTRWDEARDPFLCQLGGTGIALASFVFFCIGGAGATRQAGLFDGDPGAWDLGDGANEWDGEVAPLDPESVPVPQFPDRGVATSPEPGVEMFQITLGNGSTFGDPPGHSGRMFLYLPAGQHGARELPCVLIAPAGSNLLTGMDLVAEAMPEHLPYVRAGFAVVAYTLDGALPSNGEEDVATFQRSYESFKAARGGVINGRNALEFVLSEVPEVDPNRIFSAGHSSAGTVALLLAQHDRRIAGCAAFAPATDVASFQVEMLSFFGDQFAGINEFAARASPRRHVERLICPTLVFHALDDDVVEVTESQEFVNAAHQEGNPNVYLSTVASGGHFDPMINVGIPTAIEWFKNPRNVPPLVADPGVEMGMENDGFPGAGNGGRGFAGGVPPGMDEQDFPPIPQPFGDDGQIPPDNDGGGAMPPGGFGPGGFGPGGFGPGGMGPGGFPPADPGGPFGPGGIPPGGFGPGGFGPGGFGPGGMGPFGPGGMGPFGPGGFPGGFGP